MTFSIDNPEGGCNNPPGKYVWEKTSREQGLISAYENVFLFLFFFSKNPRPRPIHLRPRPRPRPWKSETETESKS